MDRTLDVLGGIAAILGILIFIFLAVFFICGASYVIWMDLT